MTHLIGLPILLPLAAAALLVMVAARNIALSRALSLLSVMACTAAALLLASRASVGDPAAYQVGNWPAPFGITLLVDQLSAGMLVLADVVALAALLHATQGADQDGRYFHALFQFQLAGVHGAFLTFDLFNLFVFFEILLIASYCLLLHGSGTQRLRAGVHYVILNLLGSTLFLVAIGTLYGVTGALNMAHIAVQLRELGGEDIALVRAAGLVMFVVFGLKAALVPLHFWLPHTYPTATAPVLALFAIMTKVGVYCILRVATLMFGKDALMASELLEPWLLPAAIATQLVAVLGALASRDLRRLASYLLINSIGVMLGGIALFSVRALTSSLLYLVHSTLTMSAVFLLLDHLARARGEVGDRIERGPVIVRPALLGGLFVLGVLAMAGLPPLAGFFAKAGILIVTPLSTQGIALWVAILGGSFVSLLSCIRAGSTIFWDTDASSAPGTKTSYLHAAPCLLLFGALLALSALGEPMLSYTERAAAQLLEPAAYVRSVMAGR